MTSKKKVCGTCGDIPGEPTPGRRSPPCECHAEEKKRQEERRAAIAALPDAPREVYAAMDKALKSTTPKQHRDAVVLDSITDLRCPHIWDGKCPGRVNAEGENILVHRCCGTGVHENHYCKCGAMDVGPVQVFTGRERALMSKKL